MYLIENAPGAGSGRLITKISLVMKLTAVLLLAGCLQVSANSIAQTITISEKNAPLEKVFKQIEKQTSYVFFYDDHILQNAKKVDVNIKNGSVEQVMEACLKDMPLNYRIVGNTIIVVVKPKGYTVAEVTSAVDKNLVYIDVRGRVTNENGDPIAGVTVTIKGTRQATATNIQGEFFLANTDKNAVLIFTGSNVESFEVNVAGQAELSVKLVTKVNKLDEVQIIAYGATTRRLNTGNISSINGEDIRKQPVNNPLLALEGRVPGLFITQANGVSGGGITVRIQGINSIGNGNDPLYVIDGVPYGSQMLSSVRLGSNILGNSGGQLNGAVSGGAGNPLSFINLDDIERIDVLKDADATAIYGSRAANGAILITTRKGRAGQTKLEINLSQGWGKVERKMQLLNTQEYLEMRREALKNDNILFPSIAKTPSNTDYDINGLWDTTRFTDWQKVLIGGTAKYTNISASASGGNNITQYLIGGTYSRQTSVFPGNFEDKKGGLYFNLSSSSVDQRFHIKLSGNYVIDNNLLPNTDLTSLSIQLAPDAPSLYKDDGSLNWAPNPAGTSSWTNPLSGTFNKYRNKTANLLSSATIGYKIAPGLDIVSNFGYNNLHTEEFQALLVGGRAPEVLSTSFSRTANYSYSTMSLWNMEPQLNYKYSFGNSKIDFLAGTTFQQTSGDGFTLTGTGYSSDAVLSDVKSAASMGVGSSTNFVYKYNAIFSRLNYNYEDKYILNISVRKDGSSRFGPENQFHSFWGAGLAWIFSQANFIRKGLPVLSFGKIRGSYGTTGNDQIPDYKFMSLYNPVGVGVAYQGATGLMPVGLTNPLLQWEETKKLQVGIELGFFKDRILLISNYVCNRSSNELLGYQLPIITGFNNITENFPATIENVNWEFAINTTNIQRGAFKWESGFNLTIPKNRLVSFSNLSTSSYSNQLIIGQPVSIKKVYHFMGVDPATGIYLISDHNGNPTVSPSSSIDNIAVVSTLPKYYGGFQNSFRFKELQLDFLFQFCKQIGSNYFFGGINPGYQKFNQPVSVLARWRNPGDINRIQRYNSSLSIYNQLLNVQSSDALYSDASYVRLKNISFSYRFSNKMNKMLHTNNARIYVQGQNLFTITNFMGIDPENQSLSSIPPLRVLVVGLQAGF